MNYDNAIIIENFGSSPNTCMCNPICDVLFSSKYLSPYIRCLSKIKFFHDCKDKLFLCLVDVPVDCRCLLRDLFFFGGGVASVRWRCRCRCSGCFDAVEVSVRWMCGCGGCAVAVNVLVRWIWRWFGGVGAVDVFVRWMCFCGGCVGAVDVPVR